MPRSPSQTCTGNHEGASQLYAFKEPYPKAYADLGQISERLRAKLGDLLFCAENEVVEGAWSLLNDAWEKDLLEPKLVLTGAGAIRLEWEDEHDWALSITVTGNQEYSYTTFRKPCRLAGPRYRPSISSCGKFAAMSIDPRIEKILRSMKAQLRKSISQKPFAVPEDVSKAEIASIRQRLSSIQGASDAVVQTCLKGALLGEINLLMRLDAIDRREWMVLQNEVASAAGDNPYHAVEA
jgi:hypothetical protein